MHRPPAVGILRALIVLMAALPAHAAPWVVDPSRSTLAFTARQVGEPFTGAFKKFTPVIDFDPAHPERATVTVTIDMASATVDGKDRADALPTLDWFAVKLFANATFTSTRLLPVAKSASSAAAFEMVGVLGLRGITKEITIPFSFVEEKNTAYATGGVTLDRRDFGIGQSRWASDKWVKYPVIVRFKIYATQPFPKQ